MSQPNRTEVILLNPHMICSRCGAAGEAQLDKPRRNRVIDLPVGWMGITTSVSNQIHNYSVCEPCAKVINVSLSAVEISPEAVS